MALSHDDLNALITKIHDNSGEALADISEDLQTLRSDSFEREDTVNQLNSQIKELKESNDKLVKSNSGLFIELGEQRKNMKKDSENEDEKIQDTVTVDDLLNE